MGRRQKIKDEDGISFTRQLLKLYEKFPDPEPRELGVIVDENCHGVPYCADHFVQTFRNFVFINREAAVCTIIQGCEYLAGLQVEDKVDRRGAFFLREAAKSFLAEHTNQPIEDTKFTEFPAARIAAWVVVNVYEVWQKYRSSEWAEKQGMAHYEENKSYRSRGLEEAWF